MKIKVLPHNIEIESNSNQSVMQILQKKGVYVKSVCNGQAICAECRVKVKEGSHNVYVPSQKELEQIGSGYFLDQRRLSCQMYCYGDIVVDLSEQVDKEKSGATVMVDDLKEGAVKKNSSFAVKNRLIEEES